MNNYVRKFFGSMFQRQLTQQVVRIQRQYSPTSPEEWRQHWQAKGFPWRTKPEIDVKRQKELSKCRAIVPDIEKGIYPFKGMKLSRADVEWLLAMHEHGGIRGPVDCSDERQRTREGLDLRGAHLQGENLRDLPLARTRGGLTVGEKIGDTKEQWEMAAVHLQEVDLRFADLQEAKLGLANLQEADLAGVNLQEADLWGADLQKAILGYADLRDAVLIGANLQEADLLKADLQEAKLELANLQKADLEDANLQEANLEDANLQEANLVRAQLKGANLERVTLGQVGPQLADSQWSNVNLAVIEWTQVKILGDESQAKQKKDDEGKTKSKMMRLSEYAKAVRANRQLAVALQGQGLNEDAARFVYRAQVLQRKVLWRQRNFWKWLGSAILALLAGYGYRMWRILVAYLLIVLLCAGAYFVLGMYYEPHLSFLEAMLTSITAFHGRVFSDPFLRPGEPQLWVTAFEAIMGLLIEGVFIAMLTQKFFGK